MVTAAVIGRIREGLTPIVAIVSFKDLGSEVQGEVRYEINGFGYPVISQATFRADREGKLLAFNSPSWDEERGSSDKTLMGW